MCIWIEGEEGSSNRNASRDDFAETRDESVEAGDESIEAREKTQQSCYNSQYNTPHPSAASASFSYHTHWRYYCMVIMLSKEGILWVRLRI